MIEHFREMEHTLVKCAKGEIKDNLNHVNTMELGEVIDMIKDLEEAIYYATITKAMENGDDYTKHRHIKEEIPTAASVTEK